MLHRFFRNLHNERNWRGKILLMDFLKTNLFRVNWSFWAPKNDALDTNLYPCKDFFKKFFKMKDAKKCIKMKLIVFPEKKLFKANLSIWVQKIMCRHHCNCNCNGWTIKIFLIVSTIKRAKRCMETISMVYLEKISSAQISHFGPKNEVSS